MSEAWELSTRLWGLGVSSCVHGEGEHLQSVIVVTHVDAIGQRKPDGRQSQQRWVKSFIIEDSHFLQRNRICFGVRRMEVVLFSINMCDCQLRQYYSISPELLRLSSSSWINLEKRLRAAS